MKQLGGRWNGTLESWTFSVAKRSIIRDVVSKVLSEQSPKPSMSTAANSPTKDPYQPKTAPTKEVQPFIATPSAEQEAFFRFLDDTNAKHCIVEAVAGAGKTTLLLEAGRRISARTNQSILYACFNKSVATHISELLANANMYRAKAMTLHQVGLHIFLAGRKTWKSKQQNNNGTQNAILRMSRLGSKQAKKEYLVRYKMENVPKKDISPLVSLASLVQSTLTDPQDIEAVSTLFDLHLTNVRNELEQQERIIALLPELLKLSAERKHVDFDDMIWLPNYLNLKPTET